MLLGFAGIGVSLAGALVIGVGTYMSYRDRDKDDKSDWAFILTLSGTVLFFLGWLLFLAYLFFSRGLDLNGEAFKQLSGILPDPDMVRKHIVESSNEEFRSFVDC